MNAILQRLLALGWNEEKIIECYEANGFSEEAIERVKEYFKNEA